MHNYLMRVAQARLCSIVAHFAP